MAREDPALAVKVRARGARRKKNRSGGGNINPPGLPKIIDFIFGRFESSWFQVGHKERVARGENPHSGGFQPYSRVLPRLLRGARGRIARVIAGGACPGRPGGRVGRGKSRTLSWAT